MNANTIEAAAKILAACMDYPWEHMPEQGREAMRQHAVKVSAPLVDAERDSKQYRIDTLMLEYCPSEMSKEQMDNWELHQRRSDVGIPLPTPT
jgi:hypothetical protein